MNTNGGSFDDAGRAYRPFLAAHRFCAAAAIFLRNSFLAKSFHRLYEGCPTRGHESGDRYHNYR